MRIDEYLELFEQSLILELERKRLTKEKITKGFKNFKDRLIDNGINLQQDI
jgi:hypothetical protein